MNSLMSLYLLNFIKIKPLKNDVQVFSNPDSMYDIYNYRSSKQTS